MRTKKKILFSFMARPLPPPPPLNGQAISGGTFFAASLINVYQVE